MTRATIILYWSRSSMRSWSLNNSDLICSSAATCQKRLIAVKLTKKLRQLWATRYLKQLNLAKDTLSNSWKLPSKLRKSRKASHRSSALLTLLRSRRSIPSHRRAVRRRVAPLTASPTSNPETMKKLDCCSSRSRLVLSKVRRTSSKTNSQPTSHDWPSARGEIVNKAASQFSLNKTDDLSRSGHL